MRLRLFVALMLLASTGIALSGDLRGKASFINGDTLEIDGEFENAALQKCRRFFTGWTRAGFEPAVGRGVSSLPCRDGVILNVEAPRKVLPIARVAGLDLATEGE
jgi:hypothetical protein